MKTGNRILGVCLLAAGLLYTACAKPKIQPAPTRSERQREKVITLAIRDLERPATRLDASARLVRTGRQCVPALLKILPSAKPAVQRAVCRIFARLQDPRTIPALRKLAKKSPDFHVRREAERALALIKINHSGRR